MGKSAALCRSQSSREASFRIHREDKLCKAPREAKVKQACERKPCKDKDKDKDKDKLCKARREAKVKQACERNLGEL